MTHHAWQLLHALSRWSTGSIQKFSEELDIDPTVMHEAAAELQAAGLLVAFQMKDHKPFGNAMLEITQEGLDFIQTHENETNP
ncbi:MarR family transcriptional regulator [Parapedobacter sp. 10938]|uniref:MarR family transcriptional regulator n=1 Tax=Parapedobacter flavus TaxID=3110225 RepID=UPI002DB58292|nr:hypothetical protein [Parapedobacter sp. 10938]MEC3878673.1 hypothetical protein [Parapedobacter sp. 10938]